MSVCNVSGCYAFGRYCRLHSATLSKPTETKLTEKIKNPGIAKRGEKMTADVNDLKNNLYPVFLAKPGNELCKLRLEGCAGKAETVHHTRGRGVFLKDVTTWLSSCLSCNFKVENTDALKSGLKTTKHDKDYDRKKYRQ